MMALLERFLRCWQARILRAWVPRGARVLDLEGNRVETRAWADASFDVVTLAANFGRVPDKDALCRECFRLVRPGGRALVALPSRHAVEFDPLTTPRLFARAGFILEYWRPIQFGLTCLFVLCKPGGALPARPVLVVARTPAENAVHVPASHAA